jgi:hypothetical protein
MFVGIVCGMGGFVSRFPFSRIPPKALKFSAIGDNTEIQLHPSPPIVDSVLPSDTFLAELRVVPYSKFVLANEFPRFPLDDHLVTVLTHKEALTSFIIFVSHVWIRGYIRSEGFVDIPHPDNEAHDKYSLVVDGISKLISRNVLNTYEEVYLWIDYSCLNQNSFPQTAHLSLAKIIELCDCLFTPIVDDQAIDWSYEQTSFGPLVDYKAPAFQDGYLGRAWCRLEMFLAANLPIKNSLMRDYLADRMKVAVLDKRRPHFIYGSRESVEGEDPIELFPLEKSSFDKLNPLRGYLTRSTDEPLVEEVVMTQLMPLMAKTKPGYFGSRNHLLQKHGRGRYVDEAGDSYDGEVSHSTALSLPPHPPTLCQWYESRRQGKGRMQWANGDVYVGEWAQNEMCGLGKLTCRNGDVYEGQWRDGKKHGHGVCIFKDSTRYEGAWEDNEIHGRGTQTYRDGSQYEGDFVRSVKEGVGRMLLPNGDSYEGDWSGGYMHGQGIFVHHSSGGRYEGEWRYDQKSGYGTYLYPSGAVYEGDWEKDKKHGYGTLKDHRGGCYEGKWQAGKWKG